MVAIEKPRAPAAVVPEQVVQALVQAYGNGDLSGVDDLFAPDYVEHDPGSSGPLRGPESVSRFVETYRCAFPDLRLTLVERVVEGDTVILHWTGHGTHTRVLQDLEPTGRKVTIAGTTVTRFVWEKAVEGWSNWEPAALLRQLNLRPHSVEWKPPPKRATD